MRRGAALLEELFPGFGADLTAAGAITVDVGRNYGFLTRYGWGIPFRPTLSVFSVSRDLLESQVRRRVRALAGVRFVEGRSVKRLLVRGGRVAGVELDDGTSHDADLVVDASGRGSQAVRWLSELGFEAPSETVVDAGVAYTSRVFEGRPQLPDGWLAACVFWAPPAHKRGGYVVPLEGNRTMVTLTGGAGDHAPADEAGFMQFARSLRTPIFHDAFAGLRPVGEIHVNRSTVNRFRHFERMKRMPPGFVVTGDAVVAFNPAYGQGMSVAAIEASALQRAVRDGRPVDPLSFQRTIAREVKDVWLAATGEDFRFEETKGPRPAAARWLHKYLDAIFRLSLRDPEVQAATVGVYLLDRPMTALMSPSILLRALREMLRGDAAMPATVPRLAGRAVNGASEPAAGDAESAAPEPEPAAP
jgi:2-polyprenyl-6-methoxyphenol hydroxylase-like FAD-dependent oxidoreductase